MDTWFFFQNKAGRWCWKHTAVDGVTHKGRSFTSRTDCVADAMRHAYLSLASRRVTVFTPPLLQRLFKL
jgi:hypothetical protein